MKLNIDRVCEDPAKGRYTYSARVNGQDVILLFNSREAPWKLVEEAAHKKFGPDVKLDWGY